MTEEGRQNVGFWNIVKTMEPRWAMSSMATGAVGILSYLVGQNFNITFAKILGGILVYLAIIFIILFLIFFVLRIIKFPKEVIKDLTHPIAANFFAGIFISLAVVVSGILNVLNPLGWFLGTVDVAKFFYILALIVGLIVPVVVPFMLTISENVDTKHAVGIWYLPPVGIFVLVFAGNFLALHGVWVKFIAYLNIFLMGVAFMLYFLVSALIYYRLKFHPLPAPEVAPSFVIGLAPVGVSVIAMNTYYQLINKFHLVPWNMEVVHTLLSMVSTMLYGFGFWWGIITLLII
jgi:tellurite resistance protein TehA-like permease